MCKIVNTNEKAINLADNFTLIAFLINSNICRITIHELHIKKLNCGFVENSASLHTSSPG